MIYRPTFSFYKKIGINNYNLIFTFYDVISLICVIIFSGIKTNITSQTNLWALNSRNYNTKIGEFMEGRKGVHF